MLNLESESQIFILVSLSLFLCLILYVCDSASKSEVVLRFVPTPSSVLFSLVAHGGDSVPVVTKVIYASGTDAKRYNKGNIRVTPGVKYSVDVEILRNDLAGSNERVQDITLDGKSIGGCNPDGGDYDCTFFNCSITSAVVSPTGNIDVVMDFTGHSQDCDCDEETWKCSKENTVGGRTPVTAVGRFTLTPPPGVIKTTLPG